MSRQELLKEYYDREMNVVFSLSNDYLMNTPRRGCEEEWKMAKEKVSILDEMIKEQK